jgi:hypothetical protein
MQTRGQKRKATAGVTTPPTAGSVAARTPQIPAKRPRGRPTNSSVTQPVANTATNPAAGGATAPAAATVVPVAGTTASAPAQPPPAQANLPGGQAANAGAVPVQPPTAAPVTGAASNSAGSSAGSTATPPCSSSSSTGKEEAVTIDDGYFDEGELTVNEYAANLHLAPPSALQKFLGDAKGPSDVADLLERDPVQFIEFLQKKVWSFNYRREDLRELKVPTANFPLPPTPAAATLQLRDAKWAEKKAKRDQLLEKTALCLSHISSMATIVLAPDFELMLENAKRAMALAVTDAYWCYHQAHNIEREVMGLPSTEKHVDPEIEEKEIQQAQHLALLHRPSFHQGYSQHRGRGKESFDRQRGHRGGRGRGRGARGGPGHSNPPPQKDQKKPDS